MQNKNSLILLRGLPGSGKTTLAKVLSENNTYPVFSVDDFFTDANGNYVFNHRENHLAYADCVARTEAAMINEIALIIVDNTFTLEWEMEPYFKLASEKKYRLHCVTVENRHGGHNTHGVPEEHIQRMAVKYKVVLC